MYREKNNGEIKDICFIGMNMYKMIGYKLNIYVGFIWFSVYIMLYFKKYSFGIKGYLKEILIVICVF